MESSIKTLSRYNLKTNMILNTNLVPSRNNVNLFFLSTYLFIKTLIFQQISQIINLLFILIFTYYINLQSKTDFFCSNFGASKLSLCHILQPLVLQVNEDFEQNVNIKLCAHFKNVKLVRQQITLRNYVPINSRAFTVHINI